jgi:hypothetical protein
LSSPITNSIQDHGPYKHKNSRNVS